jgi:hypothetical protein
MDPPQGMITRENASLVCAYFANYGQSFRASQIKPLGGAKVRCLTLHTANSNWPPTDLPQRPRPVTFDWLVTGSP